MPHPNHHQSRQWWRPIAGLLILAAIVAGCWFTVVKVQNWIAVKKAAQKQAAARAEEEAKNKMFLEIDQKVAADASGDAEAVKYFHLGQKYLQEKKYDWAAAAFELACQKDPVWREPPTFLGFAYLELGKPQKAQLALQRAIEVDPLYGLAHYLLGQSYFQLKRKDLAQEEFAKAKNFGFDSATIGNTS